MTRRRPEQDLQRQVVEHLGWRAAPATFWCHYPAGGWRSPIEAKLLKAMGTKAGIPDLLLIQNGICHGLELKKAAGGRLSAAPRETQDALRTAGATVATSAGLDEAPAQLERWGFLRGACQ